jgi:hypothetical protein
MTIFEFTIGCLKIRKKTHEKLIKHRKRQMAALKNEMRQSKYFKKGKKLGQQTSIPSALSFCLGVKELTVCCCRASRACALLAASGARLESWANNE